MNEIEQHRIKTHLIILALLWLHVPINIAVSMLIAGSWGLVGAASAGTAALATATWRLSSSQSAIRITNAVAIMVTISMLLASMSGNPWQVDIHMYYFAALALVAIYCDSYAIAAAAATVAVHHLLLNFTLPAAIYPGGGSLGRVILHAVILIMEAGGLIWMAVTLQRMFQKSARALVDAESAQAAAETAAKELRIAQAAEREGVEKQKIFQETVTAHQALVVECLAGKLADVARGDLTAHVSEDLGREFEPIKTDFNTAISKLAVAMLGVHESVGGVRSGTELISTASEDLSRRNEQQAASIEKTAAALDEITEAIRRSVENADRAQDIVATADSDAKKSAIVVNEAIVAMGAISQSSQKIVQIIGVIDEIAFQTNLLALNAGVEAARAGEAGAGFAVVATEVRALAYRSAQAAKEIKALISTSTTQVDGGVKLVTDTGQALERIVQQVADINKAVSDIAASAKQQAVGLGEINVAIKQIDQMTQQNAAMAEETTATTRSLSEESGRLSLLVDQFEVGPTQQAAIGHEWENRAPLAFANRSTAGSPKPRATPDRRAKVKYANGSQK